MSRLLRQREIQRLAAGDLGYETFVQNERRRAANKLRDVWKRAPWTPGATLDLGAHEQRFLDAMIFAGHRPERLSPAVLDGCRWKWRRFMLDRSNEAAWQRWCAGDLRLWIERAGRAPAGWTPDATSGVVAAHVVPDELPNLSKRRVADAPRVRRSHMAKPDRRRVRALDALPAEGEIEEAGRWFATNREALNAWAAHVTDTRGLLILFRGLSAAQYGDHAAWETAREMLASSGGRP